MIVPGHIGAVILAAGQSQRMGQPKMVLPWGSTSVLGQVVSVLQSVGLHSILAVTGGAEHQVMEVLSHYAVDAVHNPDYAHTDMLDSLRCGLLRLDEHVSAALVVLGDQPQIERKTVELLLERYLNTGAKLVIPSYHMRRGHPWLLDRTLWDEITQMTAGHTMRDFLNAHADAIEYVEVATPSILKDLDTPQDYAEERP
jgi:molybdenum cofactor cytidylyltransferase